MDEDDYGIVNVGLFLTLLGMAMIGLKLLRPGVVIYVIRNLEMLKRPIVAFHHHIRCGSHRVFLQSWKVRRRYREQFYA